MGRQSKRKQIERDIASQNQSPKAIDNPEKFVKQIEREGYRFNKIQHSPEIPNNKVDPQV